MMMLLWFDASGRSPIPFDVLILQEDMLGREGLVLEADAVADRFCFLLIRINRVVGTPRRAEICIMPKWGPLVVNT